MGITFAIQEIRRTNNDLSVAKPICNIWAFFVAGQGLEPQFLGPKPSVLPLDDPA